MPGEALGLSGVYNLRLVILSFAIAVMASYAALDLAGRVTAAHGRSRIYWLTGGAAAMGIGIWSMHFVGMLAFHVAVPVQYDVPLVLLSLLVAVLASGMALSMMSRRTLGMIQWLIGSTLMGLAIASMHYIGMAAMRMHAYLTYAPVGVAFSILIAIAASLMALAIASRLRRTHGASKHRLKIASAFVMGSAICGMHYTGMAAATITAIDTPLNAVPHGAAPPMLGAIAIGAGTLIVLACAVLTAYIDRRFAAQRAMAEAARRNEDRFRLLGDQLRHQLDFTNAVTSSIADGVCVVDHDGYISYVNASAAQMLGWSEADLIGKHIIHIFPNCQSNESDDAASGCSLLHAVRSDEPIHVKDDVFLRSDGTALSVAYSSSPILVDVDKEIPGSVVVFRDMTERKRAEEALRQSEERLAATINSAMDAIVIINAAQRIEIFNSAAEQMFRCSAAEVIGQSLDRLIPPRFRRVHAAHIEGFSQTGTTSRSMYSPGSLVGLRADGTEFPIEATIAQLDVAGQKFFTAIIRDITERKRAEEAIRESEERYRLVVEGVKDYAMFMLDPEGHIVSWNAGAERIKGYAADEIIGEHISRFYPAEAIERGEPAHDLALAAAMGKIEQDGWRVRKDGSRFWATAVITALHDDAGQLRGFAKVTRDITERKWAEEEIRLAQAITLAIVDADDVDAALEQLLQMVCQTTGWAFGQAWLPDPEQRTLVCSAAWYDDSASLELFHSTSKEITLAPGVGLPGHVWQTKKPLWSAGIVYEPHVLRASAAKAVGLQTAVAVPVLVGDDVVVVLEFFMFENCPQDDRLLGFLENLVRQVGLVIERKRIERQLAHQAFHDALTHLPNRALFKDRLSHALARAERHNYTVAVLFLDLDRFKFINDNLGHEAGDQLLITVAQRLQECVRTEDTVARLSGDEFTILLENVASVSDVIHVAERVNEHLQAPMIVAGQDINLSTSIGIALSTTSHERPDDLIRAADAAMYRAKRSGRAQYQIFDASMHTITSNTWELEQELRRAIKRQECVVYYQPKVELATGTIVGMEALVRWKHPVRGLIPPAEFIPLAEESGLILPLGQWVLEQACRQTKQWQEEFPSDVPLAITVNLSVRQFQHGQLVQDVARVLEETGLDPRCLGLEITESIVMEDAEANVAILQNLKDLGVQLAVDDFGTGYSSLSYLKRFPLDHLKIDRSFVAGLEHDPEDTAIVRAIITLADTLGMEVIAEGIETAEQMACLQAMGCTLGQGYYFSRPISEQAATLLLAQDPTPRGPDSGVPIEQLKSLVRG